MTKPFLTVFYFLIFSISHAQQLPAFGKVSQEELLMKECAFETSASAMYLLNEEIISFKQDAYDSKTIYERRARIKIFDKQGYEYATVVIPDAKSRGTKVTDLDAYVYNLTTDGKLKVEKVDRDQIFKEKQNGKKNAGSLRFTFPDLQPGCVIEYRYTRVKKNTGILEPWFFQSLIPVQISVCKINVPAGVELKTRVVATQLAEEDSSITTSDENSRYRFIQIVLHKVPSFVVEPYMSSINDNLARVEFFMYRSIIFFLADAPEERWKMMGSMLKEFAFFGRQFDMPVQGTEHLIDSIKKFSTNAEKINAVFEVVKDRVKWNTDQIFLAEDIQDAWNTRSGSSAEINILILNLLRSVGVHCKPLLISTRENGKTEMAFPTLGQFDGVDVLITDSINNFILDGTQKYQSYRIPPLNILNRDAFVIDSVCHWVSIEDNTPLMNSSTYVKATLDSSGVLQGAASIVMKDYAKAEELKDREKDEEERKDEQKDFLQIDNGEIKIDSVSDNDSADIGQPLEVKMNFHYSLSNNDNYYFLNPYLFSMFRKNPFTTTERHSDIDFGCMQHFLTYIIIDIPDNFSVEEIPRSVLLRTSDTSISFRKDVSFENNQVGIRYNFELNNPLFTKDNYPGVKAFFDKIYGIIGEQILLKRKE